MATKKKAAKPAAKSKKAATGGDLSTLGKMLVKLAKLDDNGDIESALIDLVAGVGAATGKVAEAEKFATLVDDYFDKNEGGWDGDGDEEDEESEDEESEDDEEGDEEEDEESEDDESEDEEGDEEEDEEEDEESEDEESEDDESEDDEEEDEEDDEEEEMNFAKGDTVLAKYEDDGKWYEATVTKVNIKDGNYTVKFTEDGNVQKDTDPADVKAPKAAKKAAPAKGKAKDAPAKGKASGKKAAPAKGKGKAAPAKKTGAKKTTKRK